MTNPYMVNPARAFLGLSTLWKVLVGVALISFSTVLVGGAHSIASSRARKKYEAEIAKKNQVIQTALANVEAANKRADEKEAQAALLKQQNDAKARLTTTEKQSLESEAQAKDAQIKDSFQRDQNFINSDLTLCERARDSCARISRLVASNPALAPFRCSGEPVECLPE